MTILIKGVYRLHTLQPLVQPTYCHTKLVGTSLGLILPKENGIVPAWDDHVGLWYKLNGSNIWVASDLYNLHSFLSNPKA